ncbi:MAG: hypothetical protein CL417_02295 [Acidimicrobiaceae bacterium]|nr:hypothetical protein [Acidimicrobiaceae bacterium]
MVWLMVAIFILLSLGFLLKWKNDTQKLKENIDSLSRKILKTEEIFSSDVPSATRTLYRAVQHILDERRTEQKHTRRLSSSLETLNYGIAIYDQNNETIFKNPYADTFLTGLHSDALVADAVDDMFLSRVSHEIIEREVDIYTTPHPASPLTSRKKTYYLILQTLYAEGKDIGSILSIDDISEQERLEAIRRDFVSNISHELKTPIGAIALLAETIEDEPDPKIVKKILPKIIKETDRLTDTIDDLLTLSRIEHGSREHFSEIDLLRPIMQAQDRVLTFAAQKNLEVNVILPEDSPTIFGDAIQLTSAFYNLLENSVKYSKRGGGKTTIKVENIGDIVQLSFSDNGIGIPTKDQDRIFERFYCVDRSHSGSGVGLGLAIVRHVVVNHEGLISVQSHEGVGTTFTIQLPNSNKDITKENLAPDKNQPIEPQVSNEV